MGARVRDLRIERGMTQEQLALDLASGLVGEELGGGGGEFLVVLEDPAVTGVGVDEQLAALDAVVQVL